ncbi:hypothetical protein IIC68_02935, partial [archaeon]|nr:hypothetical protein [archaeon]
MYKERWQQLNDFSSRRYEKAIRYLVLTNSGGAVAMLGFLGASLSRPDFTPPILPLVFYIVGIISAGILITSIFHHSETILSKWNADAEGFFKSKLEWD